MLIVCVLRRITRTWWVQAAGCGVGRGGRSGMGLAAGRWRAAETKGGKDRGMQPWVPRVDQGQTVGAHNHSSRLDFPVAFSLHSSPLLTLSQCFACPPSVQEPGGAGAALLPAVPWRRGQGEARKLETIRLRQAKTPCMCTTTQRSTRNASCVVVVLLHSLSTKWCFADLCPPAASPPPANLVLLTRWRSSRAQSARSSGSG